MIEARKFSFGGCIAGLLALTVIGGVAVIGCCGVVGLIGSTASVAPSLPNPVTAPAGETTNSMPIEPISPVSKSLPTAKPSTASPDSDTKRAIAQGYNRGENDLEGRSDSTPDKPIVEAGNKALRQHFRGKVTIIGSSSVSHILEAGKSWVVGGRFNAPGDSRHEFQSIVQRTDYGSFEAGNLMLDDDVVMDKITSQKPLASKQTSKSPPTSIEASATDESRLRTWTSADGKFTTEAEFAGAIAGKIKLRKSDGAVITVNSETLSEADREWIRKRAK